MTVDRELNRESVKNPLHNIRAVIFDMDGLMYDTERLSLEAWKEVAARHGIDIPQSVIDSTMGHTCSEVKALVQKYFDETGVRADASAMSRERNDLMLEKIEREGAPVKPGLYELLDHIHNKELHTALASASYIDKVGTLLKRSELTDAFDVIVHGGEATKGKPDPEIFLIAASRLGVEPEECLVLEDSENGVRAACAAGMPVVMIPDLNEPSDEARRAALRVAPSLKDLLPLI
jgi:beta-phosphoglucomutase family hydrolase